MFATRNGTVKKTELEAYNTPIKADGIIAINIRDDDELLAVRAVDPDDEIIMVSHAGLTVRFAESDVRAMGRDTTGVRGMDVGKDGQRDLDGRRPRRHGPARRDRERLRQAHPDQPVPQDQPRRQRRQDDRADRAKGALAGALVVREHQELVFISVGGMVQRTAAGGISQQGRSATGVRVMNLKDDDAVSAVALVVDTGEDGNGEAPDTDSRGSRHRPASSTATSPARRPPRGSTASPTRTGAARLAGRPPLSARRVQELGHRHKTRPRRSRSRHRIRRR